ncbi:MULTISPECIES: hypothetical protein [unclassified Bradyrhizobium]|uniref:hypothetical protein n=1 Tax=unclassified Bradyrhizobium TaxID=2631580 RepID=UPI002479EF55|nr:MULTISPECIES: hypothetical protein [unclassified Bradyrhizobium]WGR91487.1 hypothetical protein MTX20_23950 [Bradyrhizobium sp. ISRA435]WGS01762.1 hypothetical protein MTX23_13475 [Bradyrhizobium sp. ISRA436]WGS08648.1 hypothetical protein MTX18_13465 [Bradyrhizobium sp. ISRA437]WGS15536.1 hypothetical protein MTX26_13465 [Bradyrhizobium sp. ISRA443]WGS23191.1 hypothetical protein MTX22_17055 [Bradyrhizobium sp. ISRA463]
MNSQSAAGFLGALVAAIVLAAAFIYGPSPSQIHNPAPPAAAQQQAAPAAEPAPAPTPRGPVIREVPNN